MYVCVCVCVCACLCVYLSLWWSRLWALWKWINSSKCHWGQTWMGMCIRWRCRLVPPGEYNVSVCAVAAIWLPVHYSSVLLIICDCLWLSSRECWVGGEPWYDRGDHQLSQGATFIPADIAQVPQEPESDSRRTTLQWTVCFQCFCLPQWYFCLHMFILWLSMMSVLYRLDLKPKPKGVST